MHRQEGLFLGSPDSSKPRNSRRQRCRRAGGLPRAAESPIVLVCGRRSSLARCRRCHRRRGHRFVEETRSRIPGPCAVPEDLPDPRIDGLAARLDQIAPQLERLDQLAERLDRIESGRAAIRERPATEASGDRARARPHMEELYQRAKELSADESQGAEAMDAWELLAENTTDPERRAEAWLEQAKLCCDQEIAAELLTKAVETVGLERARLDRTPRFCWGSVSRVTSARR